MDKSLAFHGRFSFSPLLPAPLVTAKRLESFSQSKDLTGTGNRPPGCCRDNQYRIIAGEPRQDWARRAPDTVNWLNGVAGLDVIIDITPIDLYNTQPYKNARSS